MSTLVRRSFAPLRGAHALLIIVRQSVFPLVSVPFLFFHVVEWEARQLIVLPGVGV